MVADLVAEIVARQVVVGAAMGVVPIPGAVPPPAVLARLPKVLATLTMFVRSGVLLVAGTDSGIGVVKPHSSLPYAVPQLVGLGMSRQTKVPTLLRANALHAERSEAGVTA